MGTWIRRAILVIIVLFGLFYLVTQPEQAADAVRSVLNGLMRALNALITFFNELTG